MTRPIAIFAAAVAASLLWISPEPAQAQPTSAARATTLVRDAPKPRPRPTGGVTRDHRGGKQAGAGGVSVGPGKPRDRTPKKECSLLGLTSCPKGFGAIDLTKNKTADKYGGKVVAAGKKVRNYVDPPSRTRDHRKN